jgi:hypothetical protein
VTSRAGSRDALETHRERKRGCPEPTSRGFWVGGRWSVSINRNVGAWWCRSCLGRGAADPITPACRFLATVAVSDTRRRHHAPARRAEHTISVISAAETPSSSCGHSRRASLIKLSLQPRRFTWTSLASCTHAIVSVLFLFYCPSVVRGLRLIRFSWRFRRLTTTRTCSLRQRSELPEVAGENISPSRRTAQLVCLQANLSSSCSYATVSPTFRPVSPFSLGNGS